jgi:hypothetical protein
VISHKSNGERCPGSGQIPGEDVAVASWTPIIKGLTPHGKRHGLKVWMDEDQIADVLESERLGHDEPGMRGVYGHVSPATREELKAARPSPPAPASLPKSDIGSGETRTAGHTIRCDLRFPCRGGRI